LWQFYSYRTEAKNLGEEHISFSLASSLKEGEYIKGLVDMSQIHSGEKRDQSSSGERKRIFEIGKSGVDFEPQALFIPPTNHNISLGFCNPLPNESSQWTQGRRKEGQKVRMVHGRRWATVSCPEAVTYPCTKTSVADETTHVERRVAAAGWSAFSSY
jgi:hypothetical protein